MATPKKSLGSAIKVETAPSSGTYASISGATNLSWPSFEAVMQDTTPLDAASGFATQQPTLKRLGPCTFEVNWDSSDSAHEQLAADLASEQVRNYQCVGTDAGTANWAFAAYVSAVSPMPSTTEGIARMSVTLSPTGALTRT